MKIEINVPDEVTCLSATFKPTGEYRAPEKGEYYVDVASSEPMIMQRSYDVFSTQRHAIYQRVWVWPEYLGGWGIAMDEGDSTVWWHKKEPTRKGHHWSSVNNDIASLQTLKMILSNFTPPTITDWTIPVLNPNYKP